MPFGVNAKLHFQRGEPEWRPGDAELPCAGELGSIAKPHFAIVAHPQLARVAMSPVAVRLKFPRWFVAASFAVLALGYARAHTFGTVYNLPVPFWMYAYGAGAALVVSFVIVAYFASVPKAAAAALNAEARPGR